MNNFFEHIGVLMIKMDDAARRLYNKIRAFFSGNLYIIFFTILFLLFTFLEVSFFLNDSYDWSFRTFFTIAYILILLVSATAMYFYIKKRQVKRVKDSWKVVDYKEENNPAVNLSTKTGSIEMVYPVVPVYPSIKLKLRPQGYHNKETIGQKDIFNYLSEYYNHNYQDEIRHFVFTNFEPERGQQKLRGINGSFSPPPILDKASFIELFWVLCKEEIITNPFSDVAMLLKAIYPGLGQSVEKLPSEMKFATHYKNSPNIRTFLSKLKRNT
ncbi:hypothetical protein JoomaDRAFT_1769 [Galbibacter orientalis DSM 19592]|uniref:Uncharacterized protein n=1 Tax=Galbibacter orientalis DSM 19592 TaxID=926559 RepID=I3C583_9FLAO|nr:hypothetical protein [Galbibacter orientalis]EIJ38776.1 hypothetical protein JoomaDRAFT_1769 [Galbibacter orientalis DSM 19592]